MGKFEFWCESIGGRNTCGAECQDEVARSLLFAFRLPNTEASTMKEDDQRTATGRRVSWLIQLRTELAAVLGGVLQFGLFDSSRRFT